MTLDARELMTYQNPKNHSCFMFSTLIAFHGMLNPHEQQWLQQQQYIYMCTHTSLQVNYGS